MQLGRAAAYAIYAVVYIAGNAKDVPIQGKDVAQSCGMPTGRLLKILQQLVRARLLSSERGPAGGFRLRKPAPEISVLEIIEAIEGPIDHEGFFHDGVECLPSVKARVQGACERVADYARGQLRELTVDQLRT